MYYSIMCIRYNKDFFMVPVEYGVNFIEKIAYMYAVKEVIYIMYLPTT